MTEKKLETARLVELQLIEKIIYKKALEINRLKKNEEFQKLKIEFLSVNEALETATAELNLIEHDRKKIEDTVKLQNEKIKNINAKLFSGTITSSKELMNFQDEVKQLRQSNDNLEDKEIKLMMDIDEKRPRLKEFEEKKNSLDKEIQAISHDILLSIKSLEKVIIELQQKRAGVIKHIPVEFLKSYDELKKRKDGIAVSVMKDNFCEVCSVQIASGELEKIKDPNKIHKCPMCSRMLIINSDKIEEVKKLYESF